MSASTRIAVPVLAAALFSGVAAQTAMADPGQPLAVHAAKKKKKRKPACPKKQVRVTVNKRKSCRRAASVLPPPRAGNPQLSLAEFALADNLGTVRDSQGRGPEKLKEVFAQVGPTAYDDFNAALQRGVGRLHELAATQPGTFGKPLAAGYAGPLLRQVPDCVKHPPPTTLSDSFTSSSSGG